jgi:cytoskeletal protein CcmA (bactofilin family)
MDGRSGARSGRRPAGGGITTIGPGLTLKGEIRGAGRVEILGRFEGEIAVTGSVYVGPEGWVDANITATEISIGGVVRGNLSAETSVDILPTGSLTGTLRSGSLLAADGANVKGEVWVERSATLAEAS